MSRKYQGITADGLNKQYMLLVAQVSAQLSTFQRATVSLSNFELAYGDDSKVIMTPEAYQTARKGLLGASKAAKKQLKSLVREKKELIEYLAGVQS